MKLPGTGRTVLFAAAMLFCLLLCPSCQPQQQFYPVRGQVFVGSQPAEGALVVFHPIGDAGPTTLRPSARVEADGSFTLQSYDPQTCPTPRSGAPAGEYRVTVTWVAADYAKYRNVIPDRLQGRYGDPATSGLSAVVKGEPNELPPFRLTGK